MKKSKKFLSVLCAVCMVMAMAAPAFAAESSDVKPLDVYVIREDGSTELVASYSSLARMDAAEKFIEMSQNKKFANVAKWSVPNQATGSNSVFKGQTPLKGDDCIGVFLHSNNLETINVKLHWAGTTVDPYFYEKGFDGDHDLMLYFINGEPAYAGDEVYIGSDANYTLYVSTSDSENGSADVECWSGVYGG